MEERKPYYIIKCKHGYHIHEGFPTKHGGEHLHLRLTDNEVKRYDRNKIIELLKPYTDITNSRINCCPSELLLLWALEEVLYKVSE